MEEELEYFAAIAVEDQKQSTNYSHLIEDGLKKEEEISVSVDSPGSEDCLHFWFRSNNSDSRLWHLSCLGSSS